MPVRDKEEASAETTIRRSLLDQGWYVLAETTPGRTFIKAGDRICFYVRGVGVVAEATATTSVTERHVAFARRHGAYPFAFGVGRVRDFFKQPIVIDATLRSRLEAFVDRDPGRVVGVSRPGYMLVDGK